MLARRLAGFGKPDFRTHGFLLMNCALDPLQMRLQAARYSVCKDRLVFFIKNLSEKSGVSFQ